MSSNCDTPCCLNWRTTSALMINQKYKNWSANQKKPWPIWPESNPSILSMQPISSSIRRIVKIITSSITVLMSSKIQITACLKRKCIGPSPSSSRVFFPLSRARHRWLEHHQEVRLSHRIACFRFRAERSDGEQLSFLDWGRQFAIQKLTSMQIHTVCYHKIPPAIDFIYGYFTKHLEDNRDLELSKLQILL